MPAMASMAGLCTWRNQLRNATGMQVGPPTEGSIHTVGKDHAGSYMRRGYQLAQVKLS